MPVTKRRIQGQAEKALYAPEGPRYRRLLRRLSRMQAALHRAKKNPEMARACERRAAALY